MKVNMTPNPLDVVTIHASQGDTEAREWEFELHNNGEKIDSSSISDQLVFKAYKGGTEQILPENGTVPVTAPFVGDIKYHDATRTNQEFLYRQSPTEEDGNAKITDIKGNTIVWNQNCYSFFGLRSTLSSAINSQTDITCTASSGQTSFGIIIRDNTGFFNFIGGHTYLLSMNISEITVNNFSRISPESTMNPQDSARTTGRYTTICTPTVSGPKSILCYLSGSTTTSDNFKFNSVQIVDLTMLNAPQITDYDSFKTYYPLSFYSYDSGSLIPFNGNGIKTVGKNLLPKGTSSVYNGITWTVNVDGTAVAEGTASAESQLAIPIKLPEGNYYFNGCPDGGNDSSTWNCYIWDVTTGTRAKQWDRTTNVLNNTSSTQSRQFYSNGTNQYIFNCRVMRNQTVSNLIFKPMIRLSNADANYEPYTSSTLSFPISTYFPNGMKSAGNVYDELTESKATQRLVYYKITGNETVNRWVDNTSTAFGNHYGGALNIPSLANCMFGGNAIGLVSKGYQLKFANENKTIYLNSNGNLAIIDDSYTTQSAWLEGIKDLEVVFALRSENYVETSFTTASLVTENGEIPLSNENGVLIGKCTEELSAEPGFIDAKIKLTDGGGTCYSNKIQLHVERKPS